MKKVLFLGIALAAYANTSFAAAEAVVAEAVAPAVATGTVRGPQFNANDFLDLVGEQGAADARVPGPVQVHRGCSHEYGSEGLCGTPGTPVQTPVAVTPIGG